MKYILLTFILFIQSMVMINVAYANENIQNLLDISTYQKRQNEPYAGGTFVHIDLPEKKKHEPTFQPTPLTVSGTYKIHTPFGKETSAAFVPHATDFNTVIQILDDNTLLMSQIIQFVNTQKEYAFSRKFALPYPQTISLTDATRNNQKIHSLRITQDQQSWLVSDTALLTPGIYTYKLSYLITGAIKKNAHNNTISLSITGNDWPFPVERFSILLLFPDTATIQTNTLTFGSNRVNIPEGYTTHTDARGNIVYQLTRPLPAFADVHINTSFQMAKSNQVPQWNDFFGTMNHLLFILGLSILTIYTVISYFYLKYKNHKHFLKDVKYYHILSLRYIYNKTHLNIFWSKWQKYAHYIHKKTPVSTYILNHKRLCGVLPIFVFGNIMRKYIIAMGCFFALILMQSIHIKSPLYYWEIIVLIIYAGFMVYILYNYAEKPFILRHLNCIISDMFSKDICYGQSKTSLKAIFIRFYPFAIITDTQDKWEQHIQNQQISLSEYPFCTTEKLK